MENSAKKVNDLQIDNLPNRITMFRIILIPITIACLHMVKWDQELVSKSTMGWTAGWIFTVASITDFFDGFIARRRNIVTVFGSFLDPIADKFLTVSSLIMLMDLNRIPSVVVIILVLREMYITSLRLLATNEGISVPVNSVAKWKTATGMIGIPMLMVNEQWWIIDFPLIGILFVYISFVLSLFSAITYSASIVKKLKTLRRSKRLAKQENHD